MRNRRIVKALFSFFLLPLGLNHPAAAQQGCNDELIMRTKGSWKKGDDANMVAGPNQAPAIIRIDKMRKLIQAATPDLSGLEPKWRRTMVNSPLVSGGPAPYQLRSSFLAYFCVGNTSPATMELGIETPILFGVYVNHFNHFFDDVERTFFTVMKNRVYLLTRKVGEVQGYPMYGYNGRATASNEGATYSRGVILTRPGQSPYTPVTRGQFLRSYVKFHEMDKAKQLAALDRRPVKSDAEEEADKQRGLAAAERAARPDKREAAKASYLKHRKTDKQYKEEGIQKVSKMYDEMLKPAQALLSSLGAEDMRQPAIVDEQSYNSDFTSFLTEEQGGRMLVRLNPDYFNAALPRSAPQFLVVYWSWDDSKAGLNFKNQVEANFDFKALQAMIDK